MGLDKILGTTGQVGGAVVGTAIGGPVGGIIGSGLGSFGGAQLGSAISPNRGLPRFPGAPASPFPPREDEATRMVSERNFPGLGDSGTIQPPRLTIGQTQRQPTLEDLLRRRFV